MIYQNLIYDRPAAESKAKMTNRVNRMTNDSYLCRSRTRAAALDGQAASDQSRHMTERRAGVRHVGSVAVVSVLRLVQPAPRSRRRPLHARTHERLNINMIRHDN